MQLPAVKVSKWNSRNIYGNYFDKTLPAHLIQMTMRSFSNSYIATGLLHEVFPTLILSLFTKPLARLAETGHPLCINI